MQKQLEDILQNIPALIFIVDDQNQIVFTNNYIVNDLNPILIKLEPGYRPGDAMQCKNSRNEGKCTTTESCHFCGIPKILLLTRSTNLCQKQDVSISLVQDGKNIHLEFQAKTMFVPFGDKSYVMLILQDVSSLKRVINLERIFFHDLLNLVSSLNGIIQLIKEQSENIDPLYFELANELVSDLGDEIIGQRQLIQAENNDLRIQLMNENSEKIINSTIARFKNHHLARNKELIIEQVHSVMLKTDLVILKRVLTNMLKNALEASSDHDIVSIGCHLNSAGKLCFYVKNNKEMPRDIQLQMFKRSFSTKGENRGIGTYSMKLLGENYLKGQLYFTSKEGITEFGIVLPVN